MVKKWNEFIREFVESSDDVIGAKMQELKDLVNDTSNGQNILYEWENKDDHELVIDFTIEETSVKYEYDIDDLLLTKTTNNKIEFSDEVSSVEDGLDRIEKDIYVMLGVSENHKPVNRTYKFTTVDFTGGSDGVYALYIDGKLFKYGDYYHDKIEIWIKSFIEGVKWTGALVEEENITCTDKEMIEDISEIANIPPHNLSDVK